MFRKTPAATPEKSTVDADAPPTFTFNVVVMDGNPHNDWVALFKNKTLKGGHKIHVYQCSWMEVESVVYDDTGCLLTIAPIRESEGQVTRPKTLKIKPHLMLVRNQVRAPTPAGDRRNVLFGMMHHNIPSMNSLESIYMQLERPIMFGALKKLNKKLGDEVFPIIGQNYYCSHRQMVISPDLPAIIKSHRGMGKIKIDNWENFRDVSTILALTDQYCTGEKYISAHYGLRVQKIGDQIRVYKKNFTGSGWRSHFGGAKLEQIPTTKKYEIWAKEASQLFGGLDWFALDAMGDENGKEFIIELNGSAIGIVPEHWKEDSEYIVSLAIEKLNSTYCDDTPKTTPKATTSSS